MGWGILGSERDNFSYSNKNNRGTLSIQQISIRDPPMSLSALGYPLRTNYLRHSNLPFVTLKFYTHNLYIVTPPKRRHGFPDPPPVPLPQ